MPIIKSAVKRMKQTIKRRERNIGTKRDIKDAVKAFLEKPTAAGLSAAQSEIDTAVKKKLISKNTAARRKANLAKVAKDAGVKMEASKKAAPKTAAAKKPAAKAAPKTTTKKTTAKKAEVTKKPATKKPAAKKTPAKKAAAKK